MVARSGMCVGASGLLASCPIQTAVRSAQTAHNAMVNVSWILKLTMTSSPATGQRESANRITILAGARSK